MYPPKWWGLYQAAILENEPRQRIRDTTSLSAHHVHIGRQLRPRLQPLKNSIPGSRAEKLSAGWDVVSANNAGHTSPAA